MLAARRCDLWLVKDDRKKPDCRSVSAALVGIKVGQFVVPCILDPIPQIRLWRVAVPFFEFSDFLRIATHGSYVLAQILNYQHRWPATSYTVVLLFLTNSNKDAVVQRHAIPFLVLGSVGLFRADSTVTSISLAFLPSCKVSLALSYTWVPALQSQPYDSVWPGTKHPFGQVLDTPLAPSFLFDVGVSHAKLGLVP